MPSLEAVPSRQWGSSMRCSVRVAFVAVLFSAVHARAEERHPWLAASRAPAETLASRIPPPAGFVRVPAEAGSWAEWLRALPMKPAGAPVLLYTGRPKGRQDVHAAVVDIDVGKRDLQQCADAVMRLRAEWQWSAGRQREIAFNFTGGGRVDFTRWAEGGRPSEDGKRWSGSGKADASYASFRRYMDQVFVMAGTYSLERELRPVPLADMRIGDVFIKGGFPGHAVLVADLAENAQTKERRYLLLQSYMPAQEIHVLKNPSDADGSPWYRTDFGNELVTPEWTFAKGSLRRFP